MRLLASLLFPLCLPLCLCTGARSATIFEDGFESGMLGPAWTVTTSNDGRATVTTNYTPASGQWHLVLDDSVSDAVYSFAQATIRVDLSNKKNAQLTFKAKSLGNEPEPGVPSADPNNFDGVKISTDGGKTWQQATSFASLGTDWESFSIPLDLFASSWWAERYGPDFRIRFSEYDNAPAPLDGIAIDDVVVTAEDDQRTVLELPGTVLEGSGPHTGHVLLAFPPTNDLVLSLSATPSDQLLLPATVEIPAGQTDASFTFSVADDHLVNLTRGAMVSAYGPDITAIPAFVTIEDDDAPVARLTLPAQLKEGEYQPDNAQVWLDRAPDVTLTLTLAANPWNQLTFPYQVLVLPGSTQAVFTVMAIDDTAIDGDVGVTLTAQGPGMAPATAQTVAVDNETRILTLSLPEVVQESRTATGEVVISGSLASPLEITLTSSDPAALVAPARVTIPAGQNRASFSLAAPDNAVREGSRKVTMGALATAFAGTNRTVTVRDDEVAVYQCRTTSDLVNAGRPVRVTVVAADLEGHAIDGFTGAVQLSVVSADGTAQPVTPGSVMISGENGWTGEVTLPETDAAFGPFRFRATDGASNTGDSPPFDLIRTLDLTAADLVWDARRNRIYASVPSDAGGTNANTVLAIDPDRALIAGGVWTGQNPGKLALTAGGEFLYVALDANGTIDRIDPDTMAVGMSFAIGTSALGGTLYAQDMCTVAGQPNLLIISQHIKTYSPGHVGVAAFDNGVPRPNHTQGHPGSNLIEPSADPSVYFGFDSESTEYGFRRLRLDSAGMTEIEVNGTLIAGTSEMRSDGDLVFTTTGVEVNGAAMRRIGTFPVSGAVCPDLAVQRVYFVQLRDPSFTSYGYDRIGAFDPATFANLETLTLPEAVTAAGSLIRFGKDGLAFATETNVVLIHSSRLVPGAAPANLGLTILASPNPAPVDAPFVYSLHVTNAGPNAAENPVLEAVLSGGQTISGLAPSTGTVSLASNTVRWIPGTLAPGASAALIVTSVPQSAGILTCGARLTSQSMDPDFSNNRASKAVTAGYLPAIEVVNRLGLAANNLVYDPTRNRLWATVPAEARSPLAKSLVSIDPVTGLVSDPIPLEINPAAKCAALSGNGKYLYTGARDSLEVARLDLSNPRETLRIPLGSSPWAQGGYVQDIEVLDGNGGTSFLVCSYGGDGAAVFDGPLRRPDRLGPYTADRIERTASPGVFIGYQSSISSYQLSQLIVTPTGVTLGRYVDSLFVGAREIRGAGNLLLSSTGALVDTDTLTLLANLGTGGSPCLDLPNQRAYLVFGKTIRSYDIPSFRDGDAFNLPVDATGDWAQTCVRWGLDGFAILGQNGDLYILRWSGTIPAATDANADGFPDAWEAATFSTLNVDPAADPDGDGLRNFQEYLFVTSPLEPSPDPLQVSAATIGNRPALRLAFPRRAGLVPRPYDYETSIDLVRWAPAPQVTENVLSVQTVNGVLVEAVEALLPAPDPEHAFVRIRWHPNP